MQPILQRNSQITNSFREKVRDEVNLFLELARDSEEVLPSNIEYIKNHAVQIDRDHESFQQNGLDYKSAVIENLLTRSREFYQNITNLQSTSEDRETNLRLIQYMAFLITEIRGMDHPNSTAIINIFNQANAPSTVQQENPRRIILYSSNPDGSTTLANLISTSLSRPSSINQNNENSTNRASPIMTATGVSRESARDNSTTNNLI
jgi:hypothetical protein